MLLRKGLLCAALLLVLCGHGGAAARPVVEARALRSRQLMADGPPAAATAAPPPKTALTPAQAGLPAPAAPEEPFDVKGGTQEVKKATAQLLVQLALTGDATAVLRSGAELLAAAAADAVIPGGGGVIVTTLFDLFWPAGGQASLWDQIKDQAIAQMKSMIDAEEAERLAKQLNGIQKQIRLWADNSDIPDGLVYLPIANSALEGAQPFFVGATTPDKALRGLQYLAPYALNNLAIKRALVHRWGGATSYTGNLTTDQLKSVNQYNKQFTAAMRDSVTALHAGRQAARQWAQDQLEVVAPGANPTGNVDYSIKNKINGANWAGYGFADRPETLTRPSNQLLALKYFLAMENCVSVMYSVDQFSAAAAGWVPLFPASNPDKGKFVNVMTPTFWMGELYGYYALYHEFLDTVDVYGLIAPYNVIAAYARDDMEWANFAFKQVSKVFIADGDDSIAFLKLEYYDNTGYYPRPPSNAKSLTLQADEYITTAYVCQDDGIDSTPRGVAFVTNKGNHIEGGRSTNNCPNLQVVQAPKDFGSEKYPPRLHAVQTLTTDHVLTLRLFFGSLMNMPIQR